MKTLKNAIPIISLAFSMLIFSGCSGMSWCVKDTNNTVPAGVYIYYMSVAYSEAYQSVEENTGEILDQTIDGKNASDWIKEKALIYCKKLVEVEKRFNDMGLSLSDDEISTVNSTADSTWKQYGTIYEKFGVSKESFCRAGSLYSLKYQKVLESTYSQESGKSLSDEEFKEYFVNNYTNYSYFVKQLTNEGAENTDMTDEQIEQVKNKFEEYATMINNGTSFSEVAAKYQQDYAVSEDPVSSNNVDLNSEETRMPEDIKNALKELNTNSAKDIKVNSSYYLIYKGDINTELNNVLLNETEHSQLLDTVKSDQLEKDIENSINNSNIKVNKRVIKKYKPSMFEEKTSSNTTSKNS